MGVALWKPEFGEQGLKETLREFKGGTECCVHKSAFRGVFKKMLAPPGGAGRSFA